MAEEFVDVEGEVIAPSALAVAKARDVARFLLSELHPYARLVEIRRETPDGELLVVDLDVEVGQNPLHDIRPVERVALLFRKVDAAPPEVLALRRDFPYVPHLNVRETESPRSLCLYEDPYDEVKLRWTAPLFIERIRVWMRETAKGTLHQEDQPLEPILLAGPGYVVIPSDLFSRGPGDRPETLGLVRCQSEGKGEVFIAKRLESQTPDEPQGTRCVATSFQCQPQMHGAVRRLPKSLLELHRLVAPAGLNLLSELRASLNAWGTDPAALRSLLVLIVLFPKTRTVGGPPEAKDIWAFVADETVEQIGRVLGLWEPQGGSVGRLIGASIDEERAEAVKVCVLNPTFALSRSGAAALNGLSPNERRLTAIGIGALGSQVVTKLVRAGYGLWTLVDHDRLLPHNVARHELTQDAVGFAKVTGLQVLANHILEEPCVQEAIAADVLRPGDYAERLKNSVEASHAIVDFTASVAVSRYLARDLEVPARRVSLFLSPSGSDLVLLAEDAGRQIPLDCLEMQYYRELITTPQLNRHLAAPKGRIRFARSCRDLTSTLPEDLVALHAAIGSRALRRALAREEASIGIWLSDQDLNVKALRVEPSPVVGEHFGNWRLYTDQCLLTAVGAQRRAKLPNETGGVLIGAFDLERRIVYVVEAIPSPPDSAEWPLLYIRGSEGLLEEVRAIGEITDGMLEYVGEWHSHPDGCSASPSADDLTAFGWITEHMQTDGLPALMLIAGEQESRFFVERMIRDTD